MKKCSDREKRTQRLFYSENNDLTCMNGYSRFRVGKRGIACPKRDVGKELGLFDAVFQSAFGDKRGFGQRKNGDVHAFFFCGERQSAVFEIIYPRAVGYDIPFRAAGVNIPQCCDIGKSVVFPRAADTADYNYLVRAAVKCVTA